MSTISQRSFTGGEIAPSLYARTDTNKYATGLRTCRNFFVMRHGGVANRPGSTFVGEVKDSTKTVRLIPFVFNSDQTYVLEFGDQYMRVIRNGSHVYQTSQAITAITNANPCVVTYGGADNYANGDEIYISGIVGAIGTYLNGRNFKVANLNAGANTFSLDYMDGTDVNSTSMGSYTSGGTIEEVYTISTPYVEADLDELQFVQSADVVTIVHPSYAPRELSRTGHASWTLSTITFAPGIAAPTGLITNGGAGTTTSWVVTALDPDTGEESLQSTAVTSSTVPSVGTPVEVEWDNHATATTYYVYRFSGGVYGFIGAAVGEFYYDSGVTPDTSDNPPQARNPFGSSDNYPSTVTYAQQRLIFANTNNDPEKVWTSRTAAFKNFTTSSPIQDDDAITFTLAGRQVNEVKHLLDVGQLISLTSGGEWSITGGASGVLTPTDINPKQYSYNGSSSLTPIVIGGNALYVQARGSIVRDLAFDYQVDGYRGNDLTIFSAHLFDGYTLSDWSFQQIPHSIVWVVRSDGVLLGLTYIREHQVWAWHRHDFDGLVENVCCVPEGDEDAVYLTIKRTIDGATVRYIERFTQRRIDDIVDAVFLDSSLSYDGRNTGATTMTLSEYSSGGWLYTSTITITASASYFSSADVGNEIHLTGSDGTIIRFSLETYVSATVMRGKPNKTVPASMRSTAMLVWSRAVDQLTGLWHLEGESVSVFADGFVVANPNNEQYEVKTVSDGTLTLDDCYAVIHVGLPYTSDIETLDIDTTQGETLADKKKLVQKVTIHTEETRGLFVGGAPPTDDATDILEGLTEIKIRNDESYDSPVDLHTGTMEVNIEPNWSHGGRVFIRQIDPIPASILSVVPAGSFPFRGG